MAGLLSGSGLAQEVYENIKKDTKRCSIFFIPVIITTAPLYYASYDLYDVDVTSGYIHKDKVFFGPANEEPEEVKWMQVNYPASYIMFPDSFSAGLKTALISGLREDYQTSIFVVNSKHIDEFFSRLHLS